MFGFVYIWYDKKHKRYYIGSHKGSFEDGYVCSSSWMKSAYKVRPSDFKRKILAVVYTTRQDLLQEEQKYLNMIKPHEIKVRYYNLKTNAYGGFTSECREKSYEYRRGNPLTKEHKIKQSLALKNKPWSKKRRSSQSGNYTRKLRIRYNDVIFFSIEEAMNYSKKSRATIDRWCNDEIKLEWSKYYVS